MGCKKKSHYDSDMRKGKGGGKEKGAKKKDESIQLDLEEPSLRKKKNGIGIAISLPGEKKRKS